MTVVGTILGVEPTVTGQNFTYSVEGYTVDGYVKKRNGGAGIYRAQVMLYKQPGDQFAGFADADENGFYTLYNVPAGDYKIAVVHPGYPNETAWSTQFTLSGDITVPDIFMGGKVYDDFNGDGKSDILWRETTTGQVSVWLMNGAAKLSGGSPGTLPLQWVMW